MNTVLLPILNQNENAPFVSGALLEDLKTLKGIAEFLRACPEERLNIEKANPACKISQTIISSYLYIWDFYLKYIHQGYIFNKSNFQSIKVEVDAFLDGFNERLFDEI